jgi:UTP--glucose-1-phosphate uridylyltransferase
VRTRPVPRLPLRRRRFDCGDKAGFIEANIAFALNHPKIGGKIRDAVLDFAEEQANIARPEAAE